MKWIAILAFSLTAVAQERTFTLEFTSEPKAEFFFEGKVVPGAPYSAQAVTETTQVLADGNRITRKSSSFIARDSQGRTRREQNLRTVGPWTASENSGIAFINDPVAGMQYTLEKNSKTAVKSTWNSDQVRVRRELEDKLKQAARAKKEEAEAGAEPRVAVATEPKTATASESDSMAGWHRRAAVATELKTATASESLGTRVIEGVQVEGKRYTETIPAGKVGNEKPIEVVNETWFSPELQTVVMSRHSDPRTGDVVYTLTNISRAEPDPALFMVPQDYKLKEKVTNYLIHPRE